MSDTDKLLALAEKYATRAKNWRSKRGEYAAGNAKQAEDIEDDLRALAQPAEAVEGESLDDVLSAYGQASPEFDASTLMAFIDKYPEFASALRRYATVQLTSVPATQAEIDSLPTDAAQGAVATHENIGRIIGAARSRIESANECHGNQWKQGGRTAINFIEERLHRLFNRPAAKATHPQAAPAQGDVPPGTRKAMQLGAECLRKSGVAGGPEYADVLEYWLAKHPAAPAQGDGEEWVAGYMQGANDYVGGAQGALDQDELRADAEMAQQHYAAAPSPEPWS